MGRLQGRVAIVTGAASGIGAASARLFADEGAQVLAVDRPGAAFGLDRPGIATLPCDLLDDDAPDRVVGETLARFGRLDILFNNAGVSAAVPAAETSDAEWDHVNGVNLRAVFRLTRRAIPAPIACGRGRIVSTASTAATHTDYGLAAYSASKAGVVGLTRTLALELGRHGVTANAILPGAILTGMTAASFAREEVAAIWAKKAALKRLGAPLDIARAALFLASDDAAFVTGQAIAVDGGLTLRL